MKIAKATPFEGAPRINMPSVYGGCIGKEMLCRIPVIGKRPIRLQVEGLPEGLYFDDGIIKGTVSEDCEFPVKITAENELGSSTEEVLFKIHEDYMLQTPLLGFTSWNAFKHKVTQKDMEETSEHLLNEGIAEYGYCYVNIDSGWQKEYGGKYDAIMPNEKFPDMKAFCDKMHEKGFKCGIYSTPMLTAWGCPEGYGSIPGCTRGEPDILWTCVMGGIGKEHLEANNVKQWEEWGFDYLKYDWRPSAPTNADYMKKELLKSKREIAFCVTIDAREEYGLYWQKNCCSWRCNRDSIDKWHVVKQYLNGIKKWKEFVQPGHYYDLDMLEIGAMAWNDGVTRLTENEAIFAYSLRAFFLSPIQLSCHLDKLSAFEKDLICNEEIIKINQDSLSDYPELMYISDDKKVEVYSRTLENGDKAIAIFNMADEGRYHILDMGEFSKVRNLWTKTDLQVSKEFACVVEPHCAVILRASK